jgi:SAM-dependent methyltransferase
MAVDTRVTSWEGAVETLRRDPSQAELVRACFYDDPLIDAAIRYWEGSEWREIRAYLPKLAGHSLDIGAGRGIAAYAFARDGWRSTALEPDPSDIVGAGAIRALAAEGGVTIEVVQEWGEQLPFEGASFDVVHCRAVLHHARDLPAFCREVARVLKPGGTFIATREHVVSKKADIPAFQDAHPLHRLYGGEYAYLLSEYREAITGAGLSLETVLNPFASDINLYPLSQAEVKARWSGKLRLPSSVIPDLALKLRGTLSNVPGRLYTFVSTKPASA